MNYYYLILDLICFACPFVLSFDKNVAYYKKWRYAIIAIIFTCILFIPWDVYYTNAGYWGFNETYITGIEIFGLPIEENLFFVLVPFACIFVYECVLFYLPKTIKQLDTFLSWIHLIAFNAFILVFIILYWDRIYTLSSAIAVLLVINFSAFVFRNHIAASLLSFVFILIPFFFINSALTGSYTAEEVVWYNPSTISGLHFGTIPVEDLFYNILLVSCSLFFYIGYQRIVLKKSI